MANDIDIRVGVTGGDDIVKVTKDLTKLDKNVKGLAYSFKEGKITSQAYFKGLAQQTSALKNMGVAYKDARSYVFGLAKETKDFTYEVEKSQKAFKRQQLAIQQAGYQVGDFAVQVASGTNWVTALTQQGTQLVSFFGGPWGAAIGAAGAIVGALAVYLMKAKEASDKTAESTKELEDRIKSVDEALKDYADTREALSRGLDLNSLFTIRDIDKTRKEIEDLEEQIKSYGYQVKQGAVSAIPFIGQFLMGGGEADLAEAEEKLKKAYDRLEALRKKAAEERRKDDIESYYEQKELLKKQIEDRNKAVEEVKKASEEARQVQKDRIDLAETELQFGKDSAQVKKLQAGIDRRIYEEQLKSNGVLGNNLKNAMGLYDQANKLEEAVANSRDRAKEFAEALKEAVSAMSSLSSFGDTLDKALAVSVAKVAALKSGVDSAVSGTIAGMRFDLNKKIDAAVASGVDRNLVEAQFGGKREVISNLEASERERKLLEEANKKSGSSSEQTKLDTLIKSLMTEQEQVENWRATQLDLLSQYNDKELALIGGQAEAKLRLEAEYSSRLAELKVKESQLVTNSSKSMYSELAGLLDMFAGKSKAAAIASIAITKGLRIAEIVSSGAAAQVRAIAELGPILGPPAAAKIAAFTKVQAGIVAATGLMQAASAVKGSSGSLSGSPSGADATVATAATAAPQRVIIEGIDRNSLISGEQLSSIFDALYKENKDRGFVFEVAR